MATLFFLRVSWRSLQNPGTHGFYRFFVFEGILLLVLLNQPHWFVDPFSTQHTLSWCLLLISVSFISQSLWMLKKLGGHSERKDMPENHAFENTVNVVKEGVYRYVRHPMYSSLLFLAWGAFLKRISLVTLSLVIGISIFLFVAALVEENENVRFFGDSYREYMKQSKLFIPWLL
ncbi:MAG: isoprenylcysteine carboxylmethyltransferase family protein [Thermodesulfobacteriota bacterium]|nr:isoprenylcysteine carboxylmethyltransferase family protein [Thermodesulfobacteriota bacterium]